mgnify:CR=1 FL=1
MKYWKLLAICMLPLSFVACSDDDDAPVNSGNATVEFQSATKQVKENATGRSFDFFKQSGNPIFALHPTSKTLTTRRKNFMKNILDFY